MTSMMMTSAFANVACDAMGLAHLASDPMDLARLASDPMGLAHLASPTAWTVGDDEDEGEDEQE